MSETCIPIPVTTRGIGIHTNNYYNFVKYALVQKPPCTIHQMYRVSLLQLDVRIQCCQAASLFPFDPDTDVTYSLPFFNEFTDTSIVQENFQILAKAISSVGNFTENGISYQPYVPHMNDRHVYSGEERNESGEAFDENREIIPDPYLVTIHNLRSVVMALANSNTTNRIRRRFVQRNPLPGAIFHNDVLANPNEIMPETYDFKAASEDILAFMKLLRLFSPKSQLIEPIQYQIAGHISILCSLHHPRNALFALDGTKLAYSEQSTIRSYQPAGEMDQFDGCINLMNEFPSTLGRGSEFKDIKRWAIRCEYVSSALYNTDWLSAVNSVANNTFEIPPIPSQ